MAFIFIDPIDDGYRFCIHGWFRMMVEAILFRYGGFLIRLVQVGNGIAGGIVFASVPHGGLVNHIGERRSRLASTESETVVNV